MLIFGVLLTALGAILIHRSNRTKNSERIQELEDSLSIKNAEIQTKQDTINSKQEKLETLTEKVLGFQKKLDSNTKAIKKIAKQTSKITSNTNKISTAVFSEQKEKGTFSLNAQPSDYYILHNGTQKGTLPKSVLEKGYQFSNFDNIFSLELKLSDNKILVTGTIFDKEDNVLVELNENNWGLNKNDNFSINHDNKALEIINKKGQVNFQLELEGINIRLRGFFQKGNSSVLLAEDFETIVSSTELETIESLNQRAFDIERIFEHQGEEYLGTRTQKHLEKRAFIKEVMVTSEKKIASYFKKYSKLTDIELTSEIIKLYNEFDKIYQTTRWKRKSRLLSDEEFSKIRWEGINQIRDNDLGVKYVALRVTVKKQFEEYEDNLSLNIFTIDDVRNPDILSVRDKLRELFGITERDYIEKIIKQKSDIYASLSDDDLIKKIKETSLELELISNKHLSHLPRISNKDFWKLNYELNRDANREAAEKELFLEILIYERTLINKGYNFSENGIFGMVILHPGASPDFLSNTKFRLDILISLIESKK